jgi:hypothetical protein
MARAKNIIPHMLCPNCLKQDCVTKTTDGKIVVFTCDECKQPVVGEYGKNPGTPRDVISAVGFRGHGKTVYFASLFNTFEDLSRCWKGFYPFAIDETSLRIVDDNRKLLRELTLPQATLMNFPTPTVVKLSKIPGLGNRFTLFYDVSGEAYRQASLLVRHAHFVIRSSTVLFIVSPTDMEHPGQEMHTLLSTYVQGIDSLGGDTKKQHLVVVLSKGDRLQQQLQSYEGLWEYLVNGGIESLNDFKFGKYIKGMKHTSRKIKNYIWDSLNGAAFVNFAKERFKTTDYCIVSATGADASNYRLESRAMPKRLLDPLLWITYRSMNPIYRLTK